MLALLFLLLSGICLASCQGPESREPALQVLSGNYETDLRGNVLRNAGLFYSYEAVPAPETPAPKGYKPFYISHYGRHGSRRQIGGGGTAAWEILTRASRAGLLTPQGDSLLRDVTRLYEVHAGMDGELTLRGGQEHQDLARRMYRRFRPVFDKGGKVHCQSSMIRRCLLSMSNFAGALWSQAPGLEMDFITGEPTQAVIIHEAYEPDPATQERRTAVLDSLFHALADPSRMMQAFFLDSPETARVVPDPDFFAQHLFYIAAIAQDLVLEAGEVDLFRYLTPGEQTGMGKFFNERYYAVMGNSLEYGRYVTWEARWLLEDIVNRADAAIAAGDVAADLRFGHDSALLPLASLIGLGPMARRFPVGKAYENGFYMWKYLCMASNLQMAFYHNASGNILVKFLYNEQELPLPALAGDSSSPYYDWEVLRPYLLGLCTDKSI